MSLRAKETDGVAKRRGTRSGLVLTFDNLIDDTVFSTAAAIDASPFLF